MIDNQSASTVKAREKARLFVFIVGSQRSGTSWLQLMLAEHPRVVSGPETGLFVDCLRPIDQAFKGALDEGLGLGLPAIMSAEEFDLRIREFALGVLNRLGDGDVVIEKTPGHLRTADLIVRTLPEAAFIHIIRDPRAVVASRLHAARSWATGFPWAARSAAENARMWVADVTAGTDIARKTDRYFELRYEALLADPAGNLRSLFRWLDLDADDQLCERAVEACRIDRLRAGGAKVTWYEKINHQQFHRRGEADAWRDELSRRDIAIVECVCAATMEKLGYSRSLPARKPLALRMAEIERATIGRALKLLRPLGRRVITRYNSVVVLLTGLAAGASGLPICSMWVRLAPGSL